MKRGFLVVLKHSVTHFHFHSSSIKTFPSRIPQFPQNTSLSLWMNTQTHTSLTHIYHTNQQPSMSSPEFKSLPNSSFSFSKQHTQSPSLPKQSFLLWILKINLFLPSLSFISLDSRMWLNEWHSLIPHPSHITLHHSSLSWWVNHLKCFDVVWVELGGCDDVFDVRWEWKGKGGDCYEGWCWWNEQHMCCVVGKHDWCHHVVWMREMER